MKTAKTGRNDPCPCGSGKKYKQCCGGAVAEKKQSVFTKGIVVLVGGLLLLGAIGFVRSISTADESSARTLVWSAEHNHYH